MQKIPVGPASLLGYLGACGWLVDAVVNSIEHNQALLTGANKPAAIASMIALVATNFGRHLQGATSTAATPDEETEASFQPPESAATPDVPVELATPTAG